MADARLEGGKLFERGLAGRFVHPAVAADPLLIRIAKIADELGHLPLGFGWVMGLDVDLADALAERAVDGCNSALPALALRLNTREFLAVEGKARVVDCLGKNGRMVRDEAER